jgi:hypothetical protein
MLTFYAVKRLFSFYAWGDRLSPLVTSANIWPTAPDPRR